MENDDRDRIASLHRPSILNMRDASVQIPVWKKKPTPINNPGFQRVNQSINPLPRMVASPYDRLGSNRNRREPPVRVYGNATAAKIVYGRGPHRPQKSSNFVQGSSNSSRLRVNPDNVIEVPDDDEDIGVPVQSDPMNIVDDDPPYRPPPKKPKLNSEWPQVQSFNDLSQDKPGPSYPKDGADTMALEKQISNQDSDTIEPFTEDERDSQGVKIREGNVKEKVMKIEKKSTPHIDLRHPPPLKSKMKPKGGNHDPIATSSSLPKTSVSSYFPTKPPSASTPPTKKGLPMVPVKEFFLGTEHKKSDLGYYLRWGTNKNKNSITIKEGELGDYTDMFQITFDVPTELSAVQSMPYSTMPDFAIMAFATFPANSKGPKRESATFKMGDKQAIGKITLKFDTSHRDWSNVDYANFSKWITSLIDDCDNIRISAAKSVWDIATEAGKMQRAVLVRKRKNTTEEFNQDSRPSKRHASDDAETMTMDESTPPPVDRLNMNTSKSHDSTSVSSRATVIPQPQRTRNNPPPPASALRRSSRKATAASERSPSVDPDEVILCYPQGIPGAVNITNADFKRLQPGEFLNDTLIEFGLKLWLRNLEETNPELGKQIHVFSSFFYKKLNTRNIEDGYKSVRKWTSKFDLFSKKYIIVPINEHLHWYLAIIYHPAHILNPPLVVETQSPTTRRRAQVLSATVAPPSKPISSLVRSISATPPTAESTNEEEASSDGVVEKSLLNFNASCSITVTSERSRSATAAEDVPEDMRSSPLTDIDIDRDEPQEEISRDISPTVSDYKSGGAPATDVDMHEAGSSSAGAAEVERFFADDMDVYHTSTPSTVKPSNFYGTLSKKAQGKQRETQPNIASMTAREEEEEKEAILPLNSVPTTYIFTLDSLGSRHPQAIKQLSKYLKLEAKDKHNLSETSDPCGKMASVPVQPNFCDCGLYLLHFAQKFVTDPEKYCHIINTRTKNPSMEARQEAWEGSKVPAMRENMANGILKLSAEWKKAKEEARKKEVGASVFEVIESTDDEVDIVETVLASGKGKGKGKGAVTPKRGPAKRLR